jgi:hypothetical protein
MNIHINRVTYDLNRKVNLENIENTKTGKPKPFFNFGMNRRLTITPQDSPDLNDDLKHIVNNYNTVFFLSTAHGRFKNFYNFKRKFLLIFTLISV